MVRSTLLKITEITEKLMVFLKFSEKRELQFSEALELKKRELRNSDSIYIDLSKNHKNKNQNRLWPNSFIRVIRDSNN